jgi:hypothetical protein
MIDRFAIQLQVVFGALSIGRCQCGCLPLGAVWVSARENYQPEET